MTMDKLNAALTGRYAVSRELGMGGMATVFLAHDIRHDRDVAMKVLHPELAAALGGERFLSEIKTTAKLQHPHILPLLDSGVADGLLFYVMPNVTGETLRARLTREHQLPLDDALRIATEVADALQSAHDAGVVHRDIKPENIMLQGGHALVADFGIALAVHQAGTERMTQTGLSLGTPQYMSPEQATGERGVDARSDIYALGAVTYEMLVGEAPFTGPSVQAIVARVLTEEPRGIVTQRKAVPDHVEQAVLRALEKLPADRFTSAKEFAAAIAVPTTTGHVGVGAARISSKASASKWKRVAILLGAVAAATVVVAAWALTRPAPQALVRRNVLPLDSADHLDERRSSRIAISPDSRFVAYVGGPRNQVFVRSRDQITATALPGTEGAYSPAFSPESDRIAYTTSTDGLNVVSMRGDRPTVLQAGGVLRASGVSWGHNGRLYFVSADGRHIVSAAATPAAKPVVVTTVDASKGEQFHRFPVLLPSGRGILFSLSNARTGSSLERIAVADLRNGMIETLAEATGFAYSPSGHLIYTLRSGSTFALPFDERSLKVTGPPTPVLDDVFTGPLGGGTDLQVADNGTLAYTVSGSISAARLAWVTREGRATPMDSTWTEDFESPELSPDGRRAAVTVGRSDNAQVWIAQLDRGSHTRLTFETTGNQYPAWTPNGAEVSYQALGSNAQDLWIKRADGSEKERLLLHRSSPMAEGIWSPDGQWLVFRTSLNGIAPADIFATRLGRDTTTVTLAASPARELSPTISPDGKFVAFSSNQNGNAEVFVVPFPNAGSARWQVSTHGGTEPYWAHSGREIFFRDGDGNMVSASVRTSPGFSSDKPVVLFAAGGYRALPNHRQYSVTPDDRRFLMLNPVGATMRDKLVVVDNWFTELRTKLAKK